MTYSCKICNFKNSKKSKYKRHLKSSKHLLNEQKYIICKYCDDIFLQKSIKKHTKTCNMKINVNIKNNINDNYDSTIIKVRNDNLKKILINKSNIKSYIINCVPNNIPNIEDIISCPMTIKEKRAISKNVFRGVCNYFRGRISNNKNITNRSIYCTDCENNKFITKYQNKWHEDTGEILSNHMSKVINIFLKKRLKIAKKKENIEAIKKYKFGLLEIKNFKISVLYRLKYEINYQGCNL